MSDRTPESTTNSGAGGFDLTKSDVLHHEHDFTFAAWRNVFVVLWHNDTTLAGAAELRRQFDAFARRFPAGVGLMTIIEPQATMPSSEAREALALFMRDHGEQIRVSCVIFEGTGFRAAAVRSVVTGLTLIARQVFPHRVFATLDDATDWFFTQLSGTDHRADAATAFSSTLAEVRNTRRKVTAALAEGH